MAVTYASDLLGKASETLDTDPLASLDAGLQALGALEGTSDDAALRHALGVVAGAYARLGQHERALGYVDKLLVMHLDDATRAGVERGRADSLRALGRAVEAVDAYEASLKSARAGGDKAALVLAQYHLAELARVGGKPAEALAAFKEMLGVAREAANRQATVAALRGMGRAAADLKQPAQALEYFQTALESADDDRPSVLVSVASLQLQSGDLQQAEAALREACEAAVAAGQHADHGHALLALAHLRAGTSSSPPEDELEKALLLYRACGEVRGEANALAQMADAAQHAGRVESAFVYAQMAFLATRNIGNENVLQAALVRYANASELLALRTVDAARRDSLLRRSAGLLADARAMAAAAQDADLTWSLTEQLADVLGLAGEDKVAAEMWHKMAEAAAAQGDDAVKRRCLVSLARRQFLCGETDSGMASLTLAADDAQAEAGMLVDAVALVLESGPVTTALGWARRAVEVSRESEDMALRARALYTLGAAHHALGEDEKALAALEEGLSLGMRQAWEDAAALSSAAWLLRAAGNNAKALQYLGEALAIARRRGNASGEAAILSSAASAQMGLGNKMAALENFAQALALARVAGDKSAEGRILDDLTKFYAWADATSGA